GDVSAFVADFNEHVADLEADLVSDRVAAADGTGFELGTVERIADAHGWNVGVAEANGRLTVSFRGVEPADVEGE
ncbi:hypothetical protein, partial [Natrinema soli]